MPKATSNLSSIPLLLRAQMALGLNQTSMGELLGVSRKTVARWQSPATRFIPHHTQILATAAYPVDPELAADLAAAAGETLVSLGIAPPPPPPPPGPALAHLVDAVVMAAAEANGALSPQLRPLLLAAFDRAQAMGLTVADVARGLRGASVGAK